MKKSTNQILHNGMLFLVFTILLTSCGKSSISPTDNLTHGNSTTNVFSINEPEDKRLCLQFLVMDFLEIPDQLGDSCYVKLSIGANKSNPYVLKEVISDGVRYEYEGFGTGYYVKDNVCYSQSVMYMTWDELADANGEVKYLYNARASWKYEKS